MIVQLLLMEILIRDDVQGYLILQFFQVLELDFVVRVFECYVLECL